MKFNLTNGTFMPYRKPNDLPVYIHKNSNHPQNIKKEIPRMISKRISELSINEEIFNEACPMYEKALKDSGFTEPLSYTGPRVNNNVDENRAGKNRKRKIIWYNPPFSQNVKTNIGKEFLKLIRKHFPPRNELNKIFNKNTVKISYSCMRNVNSIISAHNKKVISPSTVDSGCDCTHRNACPLENKCLTPGVVYKATITNDTDEEVKCYVGLAMPPSNLASETMYEMQVI